MPCRWRPPERPYDHGCRGAIIAAVFVLGFALAAACAALLVKSFM